MLVLIFSLFLISISEVQASESTQIETKLVGNSIVDLNWEEKDRFVRVYAECTNFDVDDKYFIMNVIQSSTGNQVSSSKINVYSTAEDFVSFNSFVLYMVNDKDVCQHDGSEITDDKACFEVITGDYELKVMTYDGAIWSSEKFTIIDTRN